MGDWTTIDMSFFYDNLADVCLRCSDSLQVLMFVLIFAGLLMNVYKGMMSGDIGAIWRHILVSGIIVAIMPYYGEWMLAAQSTLGDTLLRDLGVDPISMLMNFGNSFGEAPFDTGSAPDIILGIFDPLTWFEYFAQVIGAWIMLLLSFIMYICFWIGFQIQIIAIYLGNAAAPIFLGMLVFEQTRDTGVKYHIGMISICFWPLGWGLGMLFAQAVMDSAPDLIDQIVSPIGAIGLVGTVLAVASPILIVLIVIIWVIVTLFIAPKIVSKAIVTGSQIGMGFISAGMNAAVGGAQAAAGAAMMVAGAAATATGAGAAVGVGMMGAGAGSIGAGAGTAMKDP
ncbi:MAG: hypothetical protein NTV80_00100 [Verrucomicrobia bacterium]|nr:hypothetical protein [Verrucomicrobiota bacterium]